MRRQVLVLSVALAACSKDGPPGEGAIGSKGAAEVAPMPAGAVRTNGPHFHVDAAAAEACAPGATCTLLAELTALDGYKVNKDYPSRFHLAPGSSFVLEGEPHIALTPAGRGRLTVKARRTDTTTPIAGNWKLSVCSDDECLVETAALSVNIP